MFLAFVLVAILATLASAFGVLGTTFTTALISALLATAITGMAFILPSALLADLSRVLRPGLLVALLVPCLWMLLQVAPMPRASNAIWSSASSALDLPIAGAITVDIGATLLSLTQYCAVVAAGIVVAAVAVDRRLARIAFNLLTTITALLAAYQIVSDLAYVGLLNRAAMRNDTGAVTLAVIGVVLSCAAAIQQRELLSGNARQRNRRQAITGLIGATAALLTCITAILIQTDTALLLAALFGAAIPISIFAVRSWLLGPWGKAGIVTLFIVAIFGSFVAIPIKRDTDPTIALKVESRQPAAERMLTDVPFLGSGAGSFTALVPIYRNIDERTSREPATAAAAITIDMGRTFFWGSLLLLLGGALVLCGGSLSRGRDYIYAGAGAGIIVAISIVVFINRELLGLTVALLAAAAGGLACAQSHGGSGRIDSPFDWQPLDRIRVRIALAGFGLLLAAQAAWVLAPERYLSGTVASPFEESLTAVSMEEQKKLKQAASIALVRGDLWAKSVLADASLLLKAQGSNAGADQIQDGLMQAVRYAPCRSDVWLTFAALAERYKWIRYEPKMLLKMAYYTGPNETNLMPARIKVALSLSGAVADSELQDMIRRDVRLIFGRFPALKPAVAEAYKSAAPDGRSFAEKLIAEVDPQYLNTVRSQ